MRTLARVIVKFFYVVALLCAIAAAGALMNALGGNVGDGIMQQTGAFAFAIGLGVIPYCIARAVEKLFE
ncbi:MAG: hypothetical protein KDK04_08600 [Candidatus Competibacteraceae bacterium]|nr:hypothetical protein [Candidatus Competibacteraceae bacterium]